MLFSKKDLQKLIIPLMFEQLLAVSVGMVDTLMVSQAGEAAISGVALVDNINRLIIQVMAALATGGAVVCSQFVGKGKEEGAKKSGAQLETVLLVFSVCMTLLSLIGTRGLLHAVFGNVSEDVMDSAVLYFTVTSLSFPFLGIYNAGAAIFRSIGNSKISMQISLLMNVINIVGNAIFVFGFHWAVFGVALATLLSRIVAGIVITLLVCGKTNPIRIDKWSELKPDGSIIKKILAIGIPSGVENGMFHLHQVFVIDAQQLHGGAARVGQGAQDVEDGADAQLLADGANIFHGGVVFLGEEEAHAHLVEQLHAFRRTLLDVHPQGFQAVGGAAPGGRRPVAVLGHLHAAGSGHQGGGGGDVEAVGVVAAGADNFE